MTAAICLFRSVRSTAAAPFSWGGIVLIVACLFIAIDVQAAQAGPATEAPALYPKRKPGLWEVRTAGAQASGLPPTRFCVGANTDNPGSQLDRSVGERGACTLGAFRPAGTSWLAESVCARGKTSVTSRAIATGDFRSGYRIDTAVQYDPPLNGLRREDKEAVIARYLGPCEDGQKPGDIVVPGMGTLNMVDGSFRAEPPAPVSRTRRRSDP